MTASVFPLTLMLKQSPGNNQQQVIGVIYQGKMHTIPNKV